MAAVLRAANVSKDLIRVTICLKANVVGLCGHARATRVRVRVAGTDRGKLTSRLCLRKCPLNRYLAGARTWKGVLPEMDLRLRC
jgi:hypothetical protein